MTIDEVGACQSDALRVLTCTLCGELKPTLSD